MTGVVAARGPQSSVNSITARAGGLASWMLAAFSAAALMIGGASPALAADEGAAQKLVETTAREIINIAASGQSTKQKSAALQRVLNSRADVARIARYTIGRKWREMSASQKSRYRSAVIPYIAARFAKGFTDFRGGSLTVQRVASVKRGSEQRVVVKSIGRRNNGGAATDIEWEIATRNGRPVVLDIKLENASLVLQQRQEILGILGSVGGNFDKLIEKLNATTAQI